MLQVSQNDVIMLSIIDIDKGFCPDNYSLIDEFQVFPCAHQISGWYNLLLPHAACLKIMLIERRKLNKHYVQLRMFPKQQTLAFEHLFFM